MQECSPEHLRMVQQDRNKTIKDKGEKGKKARRKEWMWKEAQWARKGPVNLNVKSHLSSSSHVSHPRQCVKKSSRRTVRQEVSSSNFDKRLEETLANFKNLKFSKKITFEKIVQSLTITKNTFIYVSINHNDLPY